VYVETFDMYSMLRASSLVNLLDEHLIFYSLFDKVSRLDFMTSCDRLK